MANNVYRVAYTTVTLGNETLYEAGAVDGNSSGADQRLYSAEGVQYVLGDTPQEAAAVVAAGASEGVTEVRISSAVEVATDVQNLPQV